MWLPERAFISIHNWKKIGLPKDGAVDIPFKMRKFCWKNLKETFSVVNGRGPIGKDQIFSVTLLLHCKSHWNKKKSLERWKRLASASFFLCYIKFHIINCKIFLLCIQLISSMSCFIQRSFSYDCSWMFTFMLQSLKYTSKKMSRIQSFMTWTANSN